MFMAAEVLVLVLALVGSASTELGKGPAFVVLVVGKGWRFKGLTVVTQQAGELEEGSTRSFMVCKCHDFNQGQGHVPSQTGSDEGFVCMYVQVWRFGYCCCDERCKRMMLARRNRQSWGIK
jgi:hypothetical protein